MEVLDSLLVVLLVVIREVNKAISLIGSSWSDCPQPNLA
jgi:hypothetical protein